MYHMIPPCTGKRAGKPLEVFWGLGLASGVLRLQRKSVTSAMGKG